MTHSYSLKDRIRIAWLLFRKPHFGMPALKLSRAMTLGEDEATVVTTYNNGTAYHHHFKLTLELTEIES